MMIKLLLALGACTWVWGLERHSGAASGAFKRLLMQLSGRQTKRGLARSPPAGCCRGLWVISRPHWSLLA